jgi:hypothetical protein
MLVKLKDRFAPTSRARLEEWRIEWTKIHKIQQGTDLEDWLLKWETLYTQGCTLQAPEILNPHEAIYSFLKAIGPCEFRGPWTHKLNKGTKSYEFEEVLRTYRINQRQAKYDQKSRGEHGVFVTQEGDNETSALLQGRTNSAQQGQQGWSSSKRGKEPQTDCPCGTIHRWKNCLYVMKSKRTKSWRPNRDIEAKVDAYISEKPGFQYYIQREVDRDKANRGQLRTNQDLPVSFATAFQVTQGLTLSTYELARSTILDSGATIHVCNDRTRFYNLKECAEESSYLLAGDQRIQIEGFGSVDIQVQIGKDTKSVRTITLQDTALVSSFHTSVASLKRFIQKGVHWNTATEGLTYRGQPFCNTPVIHGQWVLEYIKNDNTKVL